LTTFDALVARKIQTGVGNRGANPLALCRKIDRAQEKLCVHKPPWKIKDLQACFGRAATSTHKNCSNGEQIGRPSRTPNTERTNEKLCAHKDRRTLDGAVLLPIRSAVRQRVSMTCRRLPRQLAVESQLPKGANLSSRPVEVGQPDSVKDCSAAVAAGGCRQACAR
jgi:hypothetical protein